MEIFNRSKIKQLREDRGLTQQALADDLEKMFSEGDIRRRGNTRKWELTGRNPEN